MTKKFDIIHLNGYLYAVKPLVKSENFPYTVLEKLTNGKWSLWGVDNANDWDENNQLSIIATTNSSLNGIPLLPPIEEDFVELARREWEIVNIKKNFKDIDSVFFRNGFEKGYKAAKAKKYTEEDLWKFLDFCEKGKSLHSNPSLIIKDFDSYNNPKPIQVEIEMEDIPEKFYENEHHRFLHKTASFAKPDNFLKVRPKVDGNNFVNVLNWIYE